MPDLSIVVPVLNEEDSVTLFLERVTPILDVLSLRYEFIFVDDGSTDSTATVLARARQTWPMIRVLRLSRNFGKEAALTAGLEATR